MPGRPRWCIILSMGFLAPSFLPKIEAKNAVSGTAMNKKHTTEGLLDKTSKNSPSVIVICL